MQPNKSSRRLLGKKSWVTQISASIKTDKNKINIYI